MFCPSCGVALSQQMKYCNRCGVRLIAAKETALSGPSEKRLDDYMEGVFWTPVFGLGLILGGMALMDKVMHLGRGVTIAYMILSSTVFLVVFGLHLWQILRIVRSPKEAKGALQAGQLETNELREAKAQSALESAPSVIENTTRSLEPRSKEQIT